jgi:hypothetical protein
MATSVVIQSTVATGDTIEASRENQNRDNWSVIDVRTGGDPGAAGRIPVSSGSLATSWLAAGTNGLPLVSNGTTPSYAKVGSAGIDTLTAALNFGNTNKRIVQSADSIALQSITDRALLSALIPALARNATWVTSEWLHLNGGLTAALLVIEGDAINLYTGPAGADPVSFTLLGTVWHSGNDGSGSGLDADTVDGLQTGNSTGQIPVSNGAVCTNLNADLFDDLSSNGFLRLGGGITQTYVSPGGVNTIIFGAFTSPTGNGMKISGDLHVTGTKTRVATGHDDSIGLMHAFETPLPMFAEPRRDRLSGGRAHVEIPPDLANYLSLDDYFVFLTAEGPAHLHVAERTSESFTVRAHPGEPDISFVWCLMAIQGDMTHIERNLPVGG